MCVLSFLADNSAVREPYDAIITCMGFKVVCKIVVAKLRAQLHVLYFVLNNLKICLTDISFIFIV